MTALMPIALSECPKSAWVPDDSRDSCMDCGAGFSITLRRHHCRACGRLLCDGCANERVELAPGGAKERVCLTCVELAKKGERPGRNRSNSQAAFATLSGALRAGERDREAAREDAVKSGTFVSSSSSVGAKDP